MKRRIFLSVILLLLVCSLSACGKKDKKEDGKDGSSTQDPGGSTDTGGSFGYNMADPGKFYESGQCIQLGGSPLFIYFDDAKDWLDSSKGLNEGEKYISVPIRYFDYEDSGESLPDPKHIYITKVSDENGNDLNIGGRLQPVVDMSDSDIGSIAAGTYYRSVMEYTGDSSTSTDVWALFKVPEEARECEIEVYLTDDFGSPHSAGYKIKIKENDNYGTFEGKSSEELSKMLSTDEKPVLEDFAWFNPEIRDHNEDYPTPYRDADYTADNYLGGWKAYMIHDPDNEKGEFEAHLANIFIDNFEEEREDREMGWLDIRVKWYLGFDADGNVIDESGKEDLFIKRSYFSWNRMNNEEGDGYPDVSFAAMYGSNAEFGKGPMDMDSNFQYTLLVVRADGTGLDKGNGTGGYMPGSRTVRVPSSMAANMRSSGDEQKRDDSGDTYEDDGDEPHFGPAAAAREKEKNGEGGPDEEGSSGRGPAQYGRERDEWNNNRGYEEDDRSSRDTNSSGKKGYVIANSDTELLSRDSLKNISDEDLRLAINEIYARHGRKFKSAELQKYFDGKDWYTPRYEPDEFDKKQNEILNDVEKKNLKILTEIRSQRGN